MRKFQKTRQNISFESAVHNIYDPQYSSTQSDKSIESSAIESFISTSTIAEQKSTSQETRQISENNNTKENTAYKSKVAEIKFNVVPYKNIPVRTLNRVDLPQFLFRHNSNKSKDNFDSSLELCLQSDDCQSNRNTFSKYLNIVNNSKFKNEMKHTISSICFEIRDNSTFKDSKHHASLGMKSSVHNEGAYQNKEIHGVSFSNECKETYQIASPSHNQYVHNSQTSSEKLQRNRSGLFNNSSVLK